MKKIRLLFIALLVSPAWAPLAASARPDEGRACRESCERSARPVGWVYVCVGRDWAGRAIFRWVPEVSYPRGGSGRGGDGGFRSGGSAGPRGWGDRGNCGERSWRGGSYEREARGYGGGSDERRWRGGR